LRVRADLGAERVPEYCTIIYRTDEGDRGRVDMNKSKRAGGKFQDYSFSAKPFEGILAGLRFDVVGFDDRVRDYRIEVVDSPTVIATELECTFPPYMVDEKLSLWLPRTIELTSATQLPRGTDVTIHGRANKKLQRVDLFNPETKERLTLDAASGGIADATFTYRVPRLDNNLTLDVTLHDLDHVVTENPHRLFIAVVQDEAPVVNVRLKGIGTSVTPDVIVPVTGTILDDYAVARTWFDLERVRGAGQGEVGVSVERTMDFALGDRGSVATAIDFRDQRSQPDGLGLVAGDKLVLAAMANDKYDLTGQPNVGSGDRYQLDVVTPDALLAILEARELGLRRRFEQIIDEMSQTRDSLVRVRADAATAGAEPGDAPPDAEADAETSAAKKQERTQSLRLLRTQQGRQQTTKSMQELLGVAISFREIREELINNRIDSEDRKNRLKDLIADPLQLIGEKMFPELEARLDRLEKVLLQDLNAKRYDPQAGASEAEQSVAQVNDILAELDKILQQMLDLETFNELLDIVRQLIADQGRVTERTEAQRKQELLKDLQ
jgi:hypothetical protein